MTDISFWSSASVFLSTQAAGNCILLIATSIAYCSVRSARATARKVQTAELMFGTRADTQLSSGYKRLQTLHNAPDQNLRSLASNDKRDSEEANQIRYLLNHWERISVGIGQDIYCEKMLKETSYSTVIKLYDQALPFINAVREAEGRTTFYQDFEALAKRWKKKHLKAKESN